MTPGGKLQKGDRIVHVQTGTVCTVVEREGNDDLYSVILKPDGGLSRNITPAYGYTDCFRLLEAAYWLKQGVYKFVE